MSWWNPLTWFHKKKPSGEVLSLSEPPSSNDGNSHLEQRPQAGSGGQTLSDIVRGIAHAAAAANEIQDRQFIQQVNQYFHKEPDGTLIPKVVRAKIDGSNYIEIPLISMIDPSTLGLEEMEVRMGIRLSSTEIKKHIHDANREREVSRSSFSVSLTSAKPGERQDVIDVTMKFRKTEPAEGSARLVEEMNGLAQPKKYDENTNPPSELTHIFTSSSKLFKTQNQEISDADGFEPHDDQALGEDGLRRNSSESSSSTDDRSDEI